MVRVPHYADCTAVNRSQQRSRHGVGNFCSSRNSSYVIPLLCGGRMQSADDVAVPFTHLPSNGPQEKDIKLWKQATKGAHKSTEISL